MCGPGHPVTIRPVIDLNEHIQVDRYEVPDRLDQQVAERDLTSVFPYGTPAGYWYHVDGTGPVDLGHHGPPGDGFGDPPHP